MYDSLLTFMSVVMRKIMSLVEQLCEDSNNTKIHITAAFIVPRQWGHLSFDLVKRHHAWMKLV